MPDTAHILINLYGGAQQPIGSEIQWMCRLSDGQAPSVRKSATYPDLQGSSKLFQVEFFDNFFDDYTVIVSPDGYHDSGWFPIRVHPTAPTNVDLIALPKNGELHFADATWKHLLKLRPDLARILRLGCESDLAAEIKYGTILESRPKALACLLNIATALRDIHLPSGKSPLDYYWNMAWPHGDASSPEWLTQLDEVCKQDRFFCYVEADILLDIRAASRLGSFAPEPNPAAFHSDATESYKQTQFDVANVQLTFHGHDVCTLYRSDGTPVKVVKVEPDIDYYKDVLSHGLLEVFPNALSHGLTDPAITFALRWMAARRAGLPSFNPLYTIEDYGVQAAGAGASV